MLRLVSSKSIIHPPFPPWKGEAVAVGFHEAVAELRRHAPACLVDEPCDSAYTAVPVPVLRAAALHTLRCLAADGIAYGPQAFDCENYQRELCQNIAKIARRAGLLVSPLTGRLKVQLLHKWVDVLPGSWHALAVAWTIEGWQVIEPQNGLMIPLELYSNRLTITRPSGC